MSKLTCAEDGTVTIVADDGTSMILELNESVRMVCDVLAGVTLCCTSVGDADDAKDAPA